MNLPGGVKLRPCRPLRPRQPAPRRAASPTSACCSSSSSGASISASPRAPSPAFLRSRSPASGSCSRASSWSRWCTGWRDRSRCRRGALRRLIVLGVVGNTLYQLAFISGLDRTTASNSALILSAMPIDRGDPRRRPRLRAAPAQGARRRAGGDARRGPGRRGAWRRLRRDTMAGDLLTPGRRDLLGQLHSGPPGAAAGDLTAPGHHGHDGRRARRAWCSPACRRCCGMDWSAVGWQGWAALALRHRALAAGGVRDLEPEREGGGAEPDGDLHVPHAAGGGRRARPCSWASGPCRCRRSGAALIIAGVLLTVGQRSEPAG